MVKENTGFDSQQLSTFNDSIEKLDESVRQTVDSSLDHSIELYAANLTVLEEAAPHASCEQILKVLVARDAVRIALIAEKKDVVKESIMTLFELDSQLKKLEEVIAQGVNLASWRISLNPPPEAWWWYFPPPIHHWDRLDWLWNSLTVASMTVSFSLLADIGPRFWAGGPTTVGAFAVIGPSVLSLLAGGGALTKTGRETIERLLVTFKVPKHFWQEVSCGAAALVLLGLVGFRFSLPQIATWYNEQGEQQQYPKENEGMTTEKLASAEYNYKRALKLNPDYADPHFNLGRLYEMRQDLKKAHSEYQIAAQLGSVKAINNLARLYILDKKYANAAELLFNGLQSLPTSQQSEQKYYMHKNLGWARLGQKRYIDAQEELATAIELKNQLKRTDASPHCLMAQALENLGDNQGAMAEWRTCAQYATKYNLDEDTWLGMAQQRLNASGGNP